MDISSGTTESLIQSYNNTEQEVAKFRHICKQLEESLLHAPNPHGSSSKCLIKSTQSTVDSKSRSTLVNPNSNSVKKRIQQLEDYKNLLQQQRSSGKQCFLDALNK